MTTSRPFGDHLQLGDHLVPTWWPLVDHLVTTSRPLLQPLEISAVLHASLMPIITLAPTQVSDEVFMSRSQNCHIIEIHTTPTWKEMMDILFCGRCTSSSRAPCTFVFGHRHPTLFTLICFSPLSRLGIRGAGSSDPEISSQSLFNSPPKKFA